MSQGTQNPSRFIKGEDSLYEKGVVYYKMWLAEILFVEGYWQGPENRVLGQVLIFVDVLMVTSTHTKGRVDAKGNSGNSFSDWSKALQEQDTT